MYSRPILDKSNQLTVFIDSDSFDTTSDIESKSAQIILLFSNNEKMRFFRTSKETTNSTLSQIPQINEKISNEIKHHCAILDSDESTVKEQFFPIRVMNKLVEEIFDDDEHTPESLNLILPFLTYRFFENRENASIYITNNEKLLEKRNILSKNKGFSLSIFSIDEARIFLGLFFKKSGLYYLSENTCTHFMGQWYHLSSYEKIPHIFFKDPIMVGLFNRMSFALQALDEIGMQNYSEATPNNMYITSYHFSFLISLITGIFDNLAIKSDSLLNFKLSPMQISLRNKKFRDCVAPYPELFNHIQKFDPFIALIYEFRNNVIHREGFEPLILDFKSLSCCVKLTENMAGAIHVINDNKEKFPIRYPYPDWGFDECDKDSFLNPYEFAIMAMSNLVVFTDEYLKLLRDKSEFAGREIKREISGLDLFIEYHLGF
jgi:hypothetical protein